MSLDEKESREVRAAEMAITAGSTMAAAKLYGLILTHRGILQSFREPCLVKMEVGSGDCQGQRFKVCKGDDKIFVECFIPSERV